MARFRFPLLALPAALIALVLFVIPALNVAVSSFQAGGAAYRQVLGDPFYLRVMWTTLRVSGLSTLITAVLGYLAAYLLVRFLRREWQRRLFYLLLVGPLFTSAVVRSFGWMVILGRQGLVNRALESLGLIDEPLKLLYNEIGIVIGMTYILLPYMALTVAGVLQNIDPGLDQAAMDLGATPWDTFWRVTFPLSLPGVLAGSIMTFGLAVTAYVTPSVLSGGKMKVLAMLIYDQVMVTFKWPLGAALSVLLLLASLAGILIYSRALRPAWTEEGR